MAVLVAVVAAVVALLLAPTLTAAAPSTGFLEVCKAADGSGVAGTFRFTVDGRTVEVPVGACSAALQVTAGAVQVVEEAVPGVGVTGIAVTPPDRAVSTSVAIRTAVVTVVPGGVAEQTIVTFTNRSETGFLTVCKVAGAGITPGTNFTFTAGGRMLAVPAGQCASAGTFPWGSIVSVAEVAQPGIRVSAIDVVPAVRMVGAPDLAAASVSVAIGPVVTSVTFTNETIPTGLLQICKRTDSAGLTGSFTFSVAGQTVAVAVGLCSPILEVPAGVVTVTEHFRSDAIVTGIAASPLGRLVSTDLPGRSAQLQVVAGRLSQLTTVTFTNALQTGEIKVCKVAGPGVTLGTPFSFTVAGRQVTVPAGSCALAGTFPVNTAVSVAETVTTGMRATGITVEPRERVSVPANVATATVTVLAGPGVTEVTVTNSALPTTTVPLVAPTTPTTISVPTIPVTTSTPPPPSAPTTSTTAVVQSVTSTTVPVTLPTTTTVPSLVVTTTLPPATTSTTGVPLVSVTTTVAPPVTTTIVPPIVVVTIPPPPIVVVTIPPPPFVVVTIPPPTVPPIPPVTTPPVPTTITTLPCTPPTSAPTSIPTMPTTGVPVPMPPFCQYVPLSSVPAITPPGPDRVPVPVTTVRLAFTGGGILSPFVLALIALAIGAVFLVLSGAIPTTAVVRGVRFSAPRPRRSMSGLRRSPAFPTGRRRRRAWRL